MALSPRQKICQQILSKLSKMREEIDDDGKLDDKQRKAHHNIMTGLTRSLKGRAEKISGVYTKVKEVKLGDIVEHSSLGKGEVMAIDKGYEQARVIFENPEVGSRTLILAIALCRMRKIRRDPKAKAMAAAALISAEKTKARAASKPLEVAQGVLCPSMTT